MIEGQHQEKKSLRIVQGSHADWDELAWVCVGMANAHGGTILLGIEDHASAPPTGQRVPVALVEAVRKRIPELTINVAVVVEKRTDSNGDELIGVQVLPSRSTVAATTGGRYAIRMGDQTRTLMPEDLIRLTADRNAFTWETTISRQIPRNLTDSVALATFLDGIRSSARVTNFVKNKPDDELLEHYLLAEGKWLTNLGVLWIGRREDRARLLYAPSVQFIRYDSGERKIRKQVWDDFSLNPLQMIESIWRDLPEWREGDEITDGLFRKNVPHYDEAVVRELIANALVHRPYTTRGDIFINLYPDRLELHNPGLLPLGVTPQNILHTSVKRNFHLAKVFYDLGLMEQEGSGYDRIYESLLLAAKPPPVVEEGRDRVAVTVKSRILGADTLKFMENVSRRYDLRQRELIALGILAQHESLSSLEFSHLLELEDQPERLRDWLGRLPDLGLVTASGRTRARAYRVAYDVLQKADFTGPTTLKAIEPHRLRELVVEDLRRHPASSYSEIHQRIGREIPSSRVKHILYDLAESGVLSYDGERRWRRYSMAPRVPNNA